MQLQWPPPSHPTISIHHTCCLPQPRPCAKSWAGSTTWVRTSPIPSYPQACNPVEIHDHPLHYTTLTQRPHAKTPQKTPRTGVREHVMVEGGPRTARAFLDTKVVDRVVIYQVSLFRRRRGGTCVYIRTLCDGVVPFNVSRHAHAYTHRRACTHSFYRRPSPSRGSPCCRGSTTGSCNEPGWCTWAVTRRASTRCIAGPSPTCPGRASGWSSGRDGGAERGEREGRAGPVKRRSLS